MLEDAYRQTSDANFIFMAASLYEQLGQCPQAIDQYRRFLALTPDETDRAEAERGVRRCTPVSSPEPAPPSVPEPDAPAPAATAPTPTVPTTPPDRPLGPRYTPGIVLTSVGVVVAATGAGLWGQAARDANAARDASPRSEFLRYDRRATRLEVAGVTAVSVGAALVVAGAVTLAVTASKRRRRVTARRFHRIFF